MRILITGGAGYLGSSAGLLLLSAGHQVTVLDSLLFTGQSLLPHMDFGTFRFVRADVQDEAVLRSTLQGVDAVVHLAAIVGDPACSKQPQLARQINLEASKRLLELAREAGVQRFLFASTCSNYGRMLDTSEYATESHELRPVSLYAETKVAFEKQMLAGEQDPLAKTVLRFATLYGLSSRMRFDLTVNEFVMRMVCDKNLTVFGEQFWRPYVHVSDAARAVKAVLEAPTAQVADEVFNVGDTSENYRKLDLVQFAEKRIKGAIVDYVKRTEDPRDYRVAFEKIKTRLGFQVTRTVPDGIDQIATALESGLFRDVQDVSLYNS